MNYWGCVQLKAQRWERLLFDLSCFDDYDLIISLDDDIQSVILRSLPADSSYAII